MLDHRGKPSQHEAVEGVKGMSKFLVACAVGLVGAIAMATAASANWVDGKGSCQSSCAAKGLTPVSSGNFKNGKAYYICASNAHGEGYRAGYNLEPSWIDGCVVDA